MDQTEQLEYALVVFRWRVCGSCPGQLTNTLRTEICVEFIGDGFLQGG